MPPRPRPGTSTLYLGVFGLILFLAHAPLLSLPYHWDELGYFVPAALDLFRTGAWVPVHTLANIHPPGLPVYLTMVWSLFGYSIVSTRAAMLVLSAFIVLAAFLLTVELTGTRPAAWGAVALLVLSPLFFMQSMMAQLDLPAMLFTTLALLFFLRNRMILCVAACTALVLMKETSLPIPLVLAAWLIWERRWRQAALFVLPALALGLWLLVLMNSTGNPVGNSEFGWYNVVYPLHPVRLAGAILRRVSYLFFEEFRWIGAIALVVAWRRRRFSTRAWRVAATAAVAQALFVTILGGAVLERYLLPVLPVLYAAFAISFRGRLALPALASGLLLSNFWSLPAWPAPQENTLAMVDFVRVQQSAAAYLERNPSPHPIVTVWPFTDALRRPDLGYVSHPLPVRPVEDFSRASMEQLAFGEVNVVALYSHDQDPPGNLFRIPMLLELRQRYFRYQPPMSPSELRAKFEVTSVARWQRHGQWAEILRK